MNISRKIAEIMRQEGVIKSEELELYEYSVNATLEMGSNIIATLILGICFHGCVTTSISIKESSLKSDATFEIHKKDLPGDDTGLTEHYSYDTYVLYLILHLKIGLGAKYV